MKNKYSIDSLASGHVLLSEPEHDGCGESDCREEDLRAPVVSGCDASPVLEPSEHDPKRFNISG